MIEEEEEEGEEEEGGEEGEEPMIIYPLHLLFIAFTKQLCIQFGHSACSFASRDIGTMALFTSLKSASMRFIY